jgi:hypothetical protein
MKHVLIAATVCAVAALFGAPPALAAGSGGVTGPSIYVDGTLYRTVGTPTDLSHTGAPASSFETLYDLSAYQPNNVAPAAPGDPGYKGGRWRVHAISFTDYQSALAKFDTDGSGDFNSAAEVQAALAAGAAVDEGVVQSFECPLIHVPHS